MESECKTCINQQRIDYLEKGYEEIKEGNKVTNNNVALIIQRIEYILNRCLNL